MKDLRQGTQINRNRDVDWVRVLDKKSSDRRIGVWAQLNETLEGIALTLTDEDGNIGTAHTALPLAQREVASDPVASNANLREHTGKLGTTMYAALEVQVSFSQPWFVPSSMLNALRRDAVAALDAARAKAFKRLARAQPVQPPVAYPEDALSYLANVFNQKAHDFYAKHGVKVIAPAYEAHQELGEVSLMITKHCVRFSLSLCPKQAKGVTGVQGTVKAEPLQLVHGKETLSLRFDCKPCEMHVMGKIKPAVLQSVPLTFHKTRPAQPFGQ